MNKFITYIASILVVAFFSGCSDDFDVNGNFVPSLTAHYLRASKTTFSHPGPEAFSESFHLESIETPWKFNETPGWINLSPASGQSSASVILNAEENTDAKSGRTAIFYLSSTSPDWKVDQALSVSQGKAEAVLSVESKSVTFGGGGGTASISVNANCEWTVSTNTQWLSATPNLSKGTITITAASNPSDNYRNGSIKINYENKALNLEVTQSPSNISSSETSLVFENIASKYTLTINSETDWKAISSADWIEVTPSEGQSGEISVSIEVTPNTSISSRSGFITISTGGNPRCQISVEQKGVYIEADSEMNFSAVRQTSSLSIKSNTDWTITEKPEWISLSKTSGSGNASVEVTCEENPNSTDRSGRIVITGPGLSLSCTVNIRQQAKSLNLGTTLLEFSDKAGSQNFSITSDANWTSTVSANWFEATPDTGSGDAEITVSVQENNTTQERIGNIVYSFLDKNAQVTVHQLAKYLNVDDKAISFNSKGGTHTISISTNDKWSITTSPAANWLKISETSGDGSAEIVLTASDNASVTPRSTILQIETANSQGVSINITQAARYLTVSSQSILFFAKGGTSETVNIETDGTYEITSDASWFVVNKGSNNNFTVTATQNNSPETRKGTIKISLTNLTEGSLSIELTVVQVGEGGSFILTGFTEDFDWNYNNKGSLSLTIMGYTTDKNWDDAYGKTLNVTISGYSPEYNWNIDDKTSGNITNADYTEDLDWNNPSSSNGNFTKTNYQNDQNWNK